MCFVTYIWDVEAAGSNPAIPTKCDTNRSKTLLIV
jgi:hypothetical protein